MSEILKRVKESQDQTLNEKIRKLAKKISLRSKALGLVKELKANHSVDPRVLSEDRLTEERNDLAVDLSKLIRKYDQSIASAGYLRDQFIEDVKKEYKEHFAK